MSFHSVIGCGTGIVEKKKYVWFLLLVIFYFAFVSKINILLASGLFSWLESDPQITRLLSFHVCGASTHGIEYFRRTDVNILITDFVAFMSVTFMLYSLIQNKKKLC